MSKNIRKPNDTTGLENCKFYEYIIDCTPFTKCNGGGIDIRAYKDEEDLDNNIYADLYFDNEEELYYFIATMENIGD